MIETLRNLWQAETGIRLVFALFMLGYLTGAASVVVVCWRRLTRPADRRMRLLQWKVDDDQVRMQRQQDIINELTAEVGQLYKAKAWLAARLCDAKAGQGKVA